VHERSRTDLENEVVRINSAVLFIDFAISSAILAIFNDLCMYILGYRISKIYAFWRDVWCSTIKQGPLYAMHVVSLMVIWLHDILQIQYK